MAQNEGMGEKSMRTFQPVATDDFYVSGLCKLRAEFQSRGLERFRPYSLGSHQLRDQRELQKDNVCDLGVMRAEGEGETSDHGSPMGSEAASTDISGTSSA